MRELQKAFEHTMRTLGMTPKAKPGTEEPTYTSIREQMAWEAFQEGFRQGREVSRTPADAAKAFTAGALWAWSPRYERPLTAEADRYAKSLRDEFRPKAHRTTKSDDLRFR